MSKHTYTQSMRESSKSFPRIRDGIGPQFFSSFVLASGVAGYRLGLGIYRRAHSFLLAGHFIRTGSWLSLRFASPRPWAISYKCVVNYLPRGRDTAVLLHRRSSPPTLATSLLLHRPVTSTPTAFRLHPPTSLFLSPTSFLFASLFLSLSLSLARLSFSRVIPRSGFFPLRAVSSSTYHLLLILRHVMAPRVKETNVYLKN